MPSPFVPFVQIDIYANLLRSGGERTLRQILDDLAPTWRANLDEAGERNITPTTEGYARLRARGLRSARPLSAEEIRDLTEGHFEDRAENLIRSARAALLKRGHLDGADVGIWRLSAEGLAFAEWIEQDNGDGDIDEMWTAYRRKRLGYPA